MSGPSIPFVTFSEFVQMLRDVRDNLHSSGVIIDPSRSMMAHTVLIADHFRTVLSHEARPEDGRSIPLYARRRKIHGHDELKLDAGLQSARDLLGRLLGAQIVADAAGELGRVCDNLASSSGKAEAMLGSI